MKVGKSLIIACAAVLAITISFAWLPHFLWQGTNTRHTVPVFHTKPITRLTNSNIVDVLIDLQLHEKIGKVDFSHAMVTIELRVDPLKGRPEGWFKDVEKLVRGLFHPIQNVKRILVRMIETEEEGGRLLAAVDVRSTDEWLKEEMSVLKYADAIHDTIWRERLRVSFTTAWEERFGPVASYKAESTR